MVIPETQYTGHSLEIAVLVVLSLGSMISCSIRTVPIATIKRNALELAISMQPITKGHLLVYDGLKYRFKVLIGRGRQVTKDVVKSEV